MPHFFKEIIEKMQIKFEINSISARSRGSFCRFGSPALVFGSNSPPFTCYFIDNMLAAV